MSMSKVVSLASRQPSSEIAQGMELLRERAKIERMEGGSERKAMALIRWKARFIEYADRHGL